MKSIATIVITGFAALGLLIPTHANAADFAPVPHQCSAEPGSSDPVKPKQDVRCSNVDSNDVVKPKADQTFITASDSGLDDPVKPKSDDITAPAMI